MIELAHNLRLTHLPFMKAEITRECDPEETIAHLRWDIYHTLHVRMEYVTIEEAKTIIQFASEWEEEGSR